MNADTEPQAVPADLLLLLFGVMAGPGTEYLDKREIIDALEKKITEVIFARQALPYSEMLHVMQQVSERCREIFKRFYLRRESMEMIASALDLFWVRPVNVDREELNDGDGQTSFAGAYATVAARHIRTSGRSSFRIG